MQCKTGQLTAGLYKVNISIHYENLPALYKVCRLTQINLINSCMIQQQNMYNKVLSQLPSHYCYNLLFFAILPWVTLE